MSTHARRCGGSAVSGRVVRACAFAAAPAILVPGVGTSTRLVLPGLVVPLSLREARG